jgi:hypothetical protein
MASGVISSREDMDTEMVRRYIHANGLDPIPMREVDPVSIRLGGSNIVVETYPWGRVCFARNSAANVTFTWIEHGTKAPLDQLPPWALDLRMAVERPGCLGYRQADYICDGGVNPQTKLVEQACVWRKRCMAVQRECGSDSERVRRFLKAATNDQIAELAGVKVIGLGPEPGHGIQLKVGATTLRPPSGGPASKPKPQVIAPHHRPGRPRDKVRPPPPKKRMPPKPKPVAKPAPRPTVRPGVAVSVDKTRETELAPSHRMALDFCRAVGARMGVAVWDAKDKAGSGHLHYSDTVERSRCISLSVRLPDSKMSKALGYVWPLRREEPGVTITIVTDDEGWVKKQLPPSFQERVKKWKDGPRFHAVISGVSAHEFPVVIDVMLRAKASGRIRGIPKAN